MNARFRGEGEGFIQAMGGFQGKLGSCRLWFGAVVPLKSGFNESVSFWTLKHCVYPAALCQPPQLVWLAERGVCLQPHAC